VIENIKSTIYKKTFHACKCFPSNVGLDKILRVRSIRRCKNLNRKQLRWSKYYKIPHFEYDNEFRAGPELRRSNS